MWKSCDRGMENSPEDQTSLERDFKENAGGWFLPFFYNSKASHEHSEKIIIKVISYLMLAK